ncbi:MAG: Stp1/IreP family PP2C-type Ser/Thr phosphatase [Clostridia bacterium]|nr:Stp1/IreP family PP2C-type Ser/Thr phosphatase [Clostridia bacterium]
MEATALSHPGLVRTANEDAFLVRTELGLFAVADGLGGHLAGEVASRLAVKTVEAALEPPPAGDDPAALLHRAVLLANAEIFRQARGAAACRGMGTTLTVAWLREARLYLGHVGDSGAYHYRNGRLAKLTQDHSLVEEIRRLGGLSDEEARAHPQRHILTRALGTEPEVLVDTQVLPLEQGDLVLLCTDGLSSVVTPTEMEEILRHTPELKAAVNLLVNLVLARGAPDNVTVVLVRYA